MADASCLREVVTDYSFTLLNAVAVAFNSCDLNVYVENCINFLQNNDHINTVKCILKIDIAHLIKSVCRYKCFKNKASQGFLRAMHQHFKQNHNS